MHDLCLKLVKILQNNILKEMTSSSAQMEVVPAGDDSLYSRLENFEIQKKIGRGQFSVVHRARCLVDNSIVALKKVQVKTRVNMYDISAQSLSAKVLCIFKLITVYRLVILVAILGEVWNI